MYQLQDCIRYASSLPCLPPAHLQEACLSYLLLQDGFYYPVPCYFFGGAGRRAGAAAGGAAFAGAALGAAAR